MEEKVKKNEEKEKKKFDKERGRLDIVCWKRKEEGMVLTGGRRREGET